MDGGSAVIKTEHDREAKLLGVRLMYAAETAAEKQGLNLPERASGAIVRAVLAALADDMGTEVEGMKPLDEYATIEQRIVVAMADVIRQVASTLDPVGEG